MNSLIDKCYERFPEWVKSFIAWGLWVFILVFGVFLIRAAFLSATGLYSYINQAEDRRQLELLKLQVEALKHGMVVVTVDDRPFKYRLAPLNDASTAMIEHQKVLHDAARLDLERNKFDLDLEKFKIEKVRSEHASKLPDCCCPAQ